MLCPYCRHADGLHSGPGDDGRAADGALLAPDYACGACGQATRQPDGTWTPCPCPGWYPGLSAMQLTAATMAARAARNQLAELPPFSLTPKIGTRTTVQGDLF